LKVLLYDIETTPNVSYTWGAYEQNVLGFEKRWQLLCFAVKWLGDENIQVYSQREFTERQLVKKAHRLLSEADILIAHNGDSFDLKKLKAKFLEFGFKPPTPNHSIDTKKVAKRYFRFDQNGLDQLGELLGLGRKLKHSGFDLWLKCMAGDKAALLEMEAYNKQDVALLEKVYLKMRPWISNHPRMVDFGIVCLKCESKRVQKRGFHRTKTARHQKYQCLDCGAWFALRNSEKEKADLKCL
jgi:DNA polymerase III epsilon subunit-like protein